MEGNGLSPADMLTIKDRELSDFCGSLSLLNQNTGSMQPKSVPDKTNLKVKKTQREFKQTLFILSNHTREQAEVFFCACP